MVIKRSDDWVVDDSAGKKNGFSSLTLDQRKEIEKYLKADWRIKDICLKVGCSRGTLYYERMRFNGDSNQYDAEVAHKQASTCAKRSEIPLIYKKNISNIYKILLQLHDLPKTTDQHRQLINIALYYTELCGATPNKMKKPLSNEEKEKALEMKKQGLSYNAISVKLNRARSTIHSFIETHKDLIDQDPIEIHKKLLKKWSEFCENNEN